MNPTYETYKTPNPPLRPGSQDAFNKPSLVGTTRVPYRAPTQGCVGVLKDNKPHGFPL